MGDKSPKSKQKNQQQKDSTKQQSAAIAKAKQVQQSELTQVKGKK